MEKKTPKKKTKTLTVIIELTNNQIQTHYHSDDKLTPIEIIGMLESAKMVYHQHTTIADPQTIKDANKS